MKRKLQSFLYSSFIEVNGPLLGVLGILIGIFLWKFPTGTKISLDITVVITFVCFSIIVVLYHGMHKVFEIYSKFQDDYENLRRSFSSLEIELADVREQARRTSIPKIITTTQIPQLSNTQNIVCLLEASDLFSEGIEVSFYYIENGFEILVAKGFVNNVQQNGLIQAVIDNPVIGHEKILERLANKDGHILQNVIVKPVIRREIFSSTK